MINLDADLGGVQLRGNVGLQYVDTTQKSTGTLTNFGVNNVKDSYDRWLPSANLAFEVADDTFVKLAFAKTITRARLDQRSEEHTSELQSLMRISYAVFCLKKKNEKKKLIYK